MIMMGLFFYAKEIQAFYLISLHCLLLKHHSTTEMTNLTNKTL